MTKDIKLKRARELGILLDGWRFIDYSLAQGPMFGWMCSVIWGEKGSGKSNLMLQHGYQMFHGFDEFKVIGKDEQGAEITRGFVTDWTDAKAWDLTLDHTVFRPRDFAGLLHRVLVKKERISWVGWDDINIHFPRSMYSTNRRIWENFSKNWEGFRANLSLFECTAPRKDKVVSFILSDMNWDILVSARHRVETTRWFWDKDYYEPEKVNKFRLDIDDDPHELELIPAEVWGRYWGRKTELIDESTEGFETMLNEMDAPKHEKEPGSFPCLVCGAVFNADWNLRMHMGKHQRRGEVAPAGRIPP